MHIEGHQCKGTQILRHMHGQCCMLIILSGNKGTFVGQLDGNPEPWGLNT